MVGNEGCRRRRRYKKWPKCLFSCFKQWCYFVSRYGGDEDDDVDVTTKSQWMQCVSSKSWSNLVKSCC